MSRIVFVQHLNHHQHYAFIIDFLYFFLTQISDKLYIVFSQHINLNFFIFSPKPRVPIVDFVIYSQFIQAFSILLEALTLYMNKLVPILYMIFIASFSFQSHPNYHIYEIFQVFHILVLIMMIYILFVFATLLTFFIFMTCIKSIFWCCFGVFFFYWYYFCVIERI